MHKLIKNLLAIVMAACTCCANAQFTVIDLTTAEVDAEALVQELLSSNSNMSISNVSVSGHPRCIGLFRGLDDGEQYGLNMDSAVVLGTGRVTDVVGPNDTGYTTTAFHTPGDDFLNTLSPQGETFDACALEFNFQCDSHQKVRFRYAIGSEEFKEFVQFEDTDLIGFALNGAKLTRADSISYLHCGSIYPRPDFCKDFTSAMFKDRRNAAFIEADTLFRGASTAYGTKLPGTNHLKLVIADAMDESFDSWLFLEGGSLECSL